MPTSGRDSGLPPPRKTTHENDAYPVEGGCLANPSRRVSMRPRSAVEKKEGRARVLKDGVGERVARQPRLYTAQQEQNNENNQD
jgi:hypothetical protein